MLSVQIANSLSKYWHVIIAILLAAYLIRNKLYNGFSKYPGPWAAAYTNWWRFFGVLGGSFERSNIALHEEHGDIVRLGPNVLSFGNPQAIKDIYGIGKGFTKTSFYTVFNVVSKGVQVATIFSYRDEAYHSKYKRCLTKAFAMSTLLSLEPLVGSMTGTFMKNIEERFVKTGQTCDFAQWLQFYAFDVIGMVTYSKPFGFVEQGRDVDGIMGALARRMDYMAVVGQQTWIDWTIAEKNPIRILLSRLGLWEMNSGAAMFAAKRYAEHKAAFSAEKDIGSILERSKASGKGVDMLTRIMLSQQEHSDFMGDREVFLASVSLIVAGADTTAVTLRAIFYYLLRNPSCYSRLMAELDEAVASGKVVLDDNDVVPWTQAQDLPYLDACILEALRLFPALGLILERDVPPGGAIICGESIPEGTIVGCSAWVMHRRKDVFGEDVEASRPERWLDPDIDRLKTMNAAMFHFGAGSRTCLGKNISLLEMYKVVPSVLLKFHIELADPNKQWKTKNSWFFRQWDFDVTFKLRDQKN